MIIGHRAVGAKETRLEDFQAAVELGLDMVEFDLRMTKDNQLVIYHGPPGMEGKNILRNKTYAEIKEQSGDSAPPLFKDVSILYQDQLQFDIEIKEKDILDEVLKINNSKDNIITSFLDEVVFKATEKGYKTGLILGLFNPGVKGRLSELFPTKRKSQSRADFLLPERRIYKLSPDKDAFKGAVLWGVNKEKDIVESLKDPRIAGLITDYPKEAIVISKSIFTT
jgi:glycerophosphoryl diester phosphodiesterase